MKHLNFFVLIALALMAGSCTVTKTMTAKRLDIYGSGVVQNPVIADLQVKEVKVSGTAKSSSQTKTVNDVRNNAIADALKKANADVLVEPVFETETRQGISTVTVTGFPANYVGFRSATIDDVPLLNAGVVQRAAVAEPQESLRKGNPGVVVATVGGLALALLLILVL